MKFDPNNQLSEAELEELGTRDFDAFLNYLDYKSAWLRGCKPEKSEDEVADEKKEWRKRRITMLKGVVKNVKTDRRQWFD